MKKIFAVVMAFLFPTFMITAEESKPVKQPIVVFETNHGTFELTLKPDVAPKACENFLALVKKGFYDGVVFHRIIKDFMIQGGDPQGTGMGGDSIWGKPFADECKATVKFDKPGLLAMANRGPNTNGSQFFITTKATPWLHMKHTIFGEVTSGYDIVKAIESVPTGMGDRPVKPVKINKAYIKE